MYENIQLKNKLINFNKYFSKDLQEVLDFVFDKESVATHGELNEHLYLLSLNKSKEDANITFNNDITQRTIVYRANTGSLREELNSKKIPNTWDTYITKNALKTNVIPDREFKNQLEKGLTTNLISTGRDFKSHAGYKVARSNENVLGLKNIVIDIDCHDDLSPDELLSIRESFMSNYQEMFYENLPAPTVIYWTGRGFQIWYSIQEAYCKTQSWLYDIIVGKIIEVYENKISEYKISLDGLEVDRSASKNICGLVRLFGMPNSKAKEGLEPEVLFFERNKYTLDDLKDVLHIEIKKRKKQSKRSTKTAIYKYNTSFLPKKRVAIIEQFVKTRGKLKGSENRHNIVHLLYNNLVQIIDRDKAKNKVIEFNHKYFMVPLSGRELDATFRCVDNIKPFGYYKYTNQDFFDKLGLYDVEETLKYCKTSKIKYKKESISTKKAERNDRLLQVYAETGSFRVAAKSAKVCLNTAKKIIKQYPEKIERINRKMRAFRDRKIFNNYLNSRSIEKAAKAGNCCVNTAKTVIDKYCDLRENLMRLIEKDIPDLYDLINIITASHHNVLYKNEFNMIANTIYEKTGLEHEYINIALCPYLQIV